MTNERPSDEVTAGVVGKWKGWDIANSCYDERFDERHGSVFTPMGHMDYKNAYDNGVERIYCFDPRDDTDAALELLAMLGPRIRHKLGEVWLEEGQWFVGYWGDDFRYKKVDHRIPLAGQPFRYAVVHLAAVVLGVSSESSP